MGWGAAIHVDRARRGAWNGDVDCDLRKDCKAGQLAATWAQAQTHAAGAYAKRKIHSRPAGMVNAGAGRSTPSNTPLAPHSKAQAQPWLSRGRNVLMMNPS